MSVQGANGSYLRFTALHQLNEVIKQDVPVPLAETFCIVGHLEETWRVLPDSQNLMGKCDEGLLIEASHVQEQFPYSTSSGLKLCPSNALISATL